MAAFLFQEGDSVVTIYQQELVRQEAGKYYTLWHAQAQYYAVNC